MGVICDVWNDVEDVDTFGMCARDCYMNTANAQTNQPLTVLQTHWDSQA